MSKKSCICLEIINCSCLFGTFNSRYNLFFDLSWYLIPAIITFLKRIFLLPIPKRYQFLSNPKYLQSIAVHWGCYKVTKNTPSQWLIWHKPKNVSDRDINFPQQFYFWIFVKFISADFCLKGAKFYLVLRHLLPATFSSLKLTLVLPIVWKSVNMHKNAG